MSAPTAERTPLEQISHALMKALLERTGLEASALKAARALVDGVIQADSEREIAILRAAEGLPQAWTSVDQAVITVQYRGRDKQQTLQRGSFVKVQGLGKRNSETGERSDSDGWKVTGIARRGHDINVVLLKAGREATVKLNRILGVKP
jgi:hypothetical protein